MRKKIYALFSVLAIASMLLVACGGGDTTSPGFVEGGSDFHTPTEPPTEEPDDGGAASEVPDLTGETITIYHFGDISGPYAAITGPLVNGSNDYVDYLNENGGIFGAQIQLEFADTGGSVDEAVAAYERFTTEDDNVLAFIMYGSPEEEALYERVAEDQIPVLAAGLSSTAFYGIPDGYMFGLGPIYPDQFGFFLDYIVANWDDVKPEGAGDDINLALLSWPGAFGQGALTTESRAYAEELGVNIVWEEQYDLSPSADTTAAILNAEAAGANVIYTNTLAFGPAALLNGLNDLGLRSNFVVGGCNWAMDVGTFAFLNDPSYGVGFYAPFPFAWWQETDNPAIQLAQELFDKYERGPGEHNVGRLLIQGGLDLAKLALENAILEVGFENLTGQDVYNALIQIENYNVLNGLATATYTNGQRSPNLMQLRQIQGGPDAFNIIVDFSPASDLRPK
ncbi:MAG: ABC transporter substrate-binding protein [Anaerolineae bacterium]|nr:ABC transporter substrate-binding protein [Anaerolineae bacterium]